jgi:hypothetical protein
MKPSAAISFLVLTGTIFSSTQLPVFHTSGRFLLDQCGDTLVIRGIEMPVNQIEYLPEVEKTKANFVRILVSIPPAEYPVTLGALDSMLALTKKLGMAADVSVDNGAADGSAFVQSDVKAVLMKYEDIITLHACGEGKQPTAEQWLQDSKKAITTIRNGGYRCPLYVLSTTYGRDPFTVIQNGRKLVDYDPLKNIICGVQLYWGYSSTGKPGWYISDYHMTDSAAIDTFAKLDFPVVAGINNHDPYGDPWLNYETQLTECQKHKISWFWWDWYNPWDGSGKYHLSMTGKYGDWGIALAGAPDLDKITISGGESATVTYEAESFSKNANVGWGKLSHSSVSGGEFLCCSGKMSPDWAEWNNIDGGSNGGQRTLTITYTNGSEVEIQPLTIILNGDSVGTFTCGYSGPGASDNNFWRVWADESKTITLRPGMNVLRLVSTAKTGFFNPDYAERTIVSHPASIQNTSKRSRYVLGNGCGGVNGNIEYSTFKNKVRLTEQGTTRLIITDITGKVLCRVKYLDKSTALRAVQSLSHGMYFVLYENKLMQTIRIEKFVR